MDLKVGALVHFVVLYCAWSSYVDQDVLVSEGSRGFKPQL